jgi:hypothetical protein
MDVVVAEVSFDAAWLSVSYPSELKYEVHGGSCGSFCESITESFGLARMS